MPQRIVAYDEALVSFQEATREVEALLQKVREGFGKLQQWQRLMVFNTKFSFPPELALRSNTVVLDSRDWPTAEQLAEVLVRWQRASKAVRMALEAVPTSMRKGLRAIPDYDPGKMQ
jgi:hypothetical protein